MAYRSVAMSVQRRCRSGAMVGIVVVFAAALVLSGAMAVRADDSAGRVVALADLDPDQPWRVVSFDVDGLGLIESWLVSTDLQTEARPWWNFWSSAEPFVPAYFMQDLEQIQRSLEADGYYDVHVTSEIRVLREPSGRTLGAAGEPGEVAVQVRVERGEPVVVCAIYLDLGSPPSPRDPDPGSSLRAHARDESSDPSAHGLDSEFVPAAQDEDLSVLRQRLGFRVGDRFEQSAYEDGAQQLAAHFAERSYPFAKVERAARVDVATRCVDVSYRVARGERARFGETTIRGLGGLREELVTRELAYARGEPFDLRKLRETERRLRGLKIFSIARAELQPIDAAGEVPIEIDLTRGLEREVRLGAGFSSEEGVRGLAAWSHFNFFGGGQQVSTLARISQITRLVSASYTQPHFPGVGNKSSLTFNLGQDDESTYRDDYWRGVPQIDWRVGPRLAGVSFLRSAYDSLSGVSDATKDELRTYQAAGFTLSAGTTVRWTSVDDILDPRLGYVVGFSGELAGGPVLGADFSWLRLISSFRGYYPIAGELVGAVRATLGTITPYDGTPEVPLWDRFYAGGAGIYPVRGYGRRRIGPITGSNDPLGGRSLALGSLEVRHPVYGPLLGVLFVDVGSVDIPAWTLDPSSLQPGVGFGLRAGSPVGPIEIDLGFGLDRPEGDSLVQVSFSIGPEF